MEAEASLPVVKYSFLCQPDIQGDVIIGYRFSIWGYLRCRVTMGLLPLGLTTRIY